MKVAHIILRVADMDSSVAFYRDVVGLDVLSESAAFTFLDGGGIRIALNAGPDRGQGAEASLTEIVLEVDDVRAAHVAMTERGVPFEVPLRAVMEHDGRSLLAAHFRDPDGHLLSITGWVTER